MILANQYSVILETSILQLQHQMASILQFWKLVFFSYNTSQLLSYNCGNQYSLVTILANQYSVILETSILQLQYQPTSILQCWKLVFFSYNTSQLLSYNCGNQYSLVTILANQQFTILESSILQLQYQPASIPQNRKLVVGICEPAPGGTCEYMYRVTIILYCHISKVD